MKTRIISGIVLALIVAGVLCLGFMVSFYFVTAFLTVMAAVGAYELAKNVAGIKNKFANFLCVAATAGFMIIYNIPFRKQLVVFANSIRKSGNYKKIGALLHLISESGTFCFMIGYFMVAIIVIVARHKEFDLSKIFVFLATPRILGFAFSCIDRIIEHSNGIYYLLLLLTFSCICDMGAYFTGVTIGKHKLCPEISPKKTVEGLVGGIISAILVSIILMLCFSVKGKMLFTCIFTVPLCILGVFGDLFASVIKRSVGIKDYGNIIPGHGGVIDRMDSTLLIAPVMLLIMMSGLI